MALQKIYAQLSCTDLEASKSWFTTLFGRAPDTAPMQHLVEWHHGSEAGLQLFQNPDAAGKGTLTLIVSALAEERARLAKLNPGEIERADYVDIVRLKDADGNLIVLAQPRAL